MAIKFFCQACRRTVYLSKDDTPVCPVCSRPLLQPVETDKKT